MGHSSGLLGHVIFMLVCYRVVLHLELNFTPNKNQAWQCHMSHIWFTSKIIWKLMYEHSNLDFEMEKFWPKTYTIVKLEKPVETTKTGLCLVCKFLKWTLTEDWTAVIVLIGLGPVRSRSFSSLETGPSNTIWSTTQVAYIYSCCPLFLTIILSSSYIK